MAVPDLSPRLAGQEILGDNPSFAWNPLVGGPASVDEFLGNTPGTTAGSSQQMYAASGRFIAPTSAAVTASLDLLASYAGLSYPLGLPTGLRFPMDYVFTPKWVYFLPQEFQPGSVGSYAGNQYSATFKVIFRQTS